MLDKRETDRQTETETETDRQTEKGERYTMPQNPRDLATPIPSGVAIKTFFKPVLTWGHS